MMMFPIFLIMYTQGAELNTEYNVCPICQDTPTDPLYPSCCSNMNQGRNAFCRDCIAYYLEHRAHFRVFQAVCQHCHQRLPFEEDWPFPILQRINGLFQKAKQFRMENKHEDVIRVTTLALELQNQLQGIRSTYSEQNKVQKGALIAQRVNSYIELGRHDDAVIDILCAIDSEDPRDKEDEKFLNYLRMLEIGSNELAHIGHKLYDLGRFSEAFEFLNEARLKKPNDETVKNYFHLSLWKSFDDLFAEQTKS